MKPRSVIHKLVCRSPVIHKTPCPAAEHHTPAIGAQAEALGHHIAGDVTLRDLSTESGGGPIFLSPGLS